MAQPEKSAAQCTHTPAAHRVVIQVHGTIPPSTSSESMGRWAAAPPLLFFVFSFLSLLAPAPPRNARQVASRAALGSLICSASAEESVAGALIGCCSERNILGASGVCLALPQGHVAEGQWASCLAPSPQCTASVGAPSYRLLQNGTHHTATNSQGRTAGIFVFFFVFATDVSLVQES